MKNYLLRIQLDSLPIVLCLIMFLTGFSANDLRDIETAILKKDFNQAEKLSKQLLDTHPPKEASQQVSYYLGLSQINLGKSREAEDIFRKLIQEVPPSVLRDKAYLGLFDVYYLEERYPEALNVIQKLLKTSPHSEYLSLIYLKAARVNLKLAQWNKASEYLKNIINGFPNSLEIYTARQLLEEKQYFAVQIGSFLERERAEQLVAELKQKGQYSYIIETIDQQNKKYFRVRVGQFSLLDDAQKLKSELAKLGYPTQIFP